MTTREGRRVQADRRAAAGGEPRPAIMPATGPRARWPGCRGGSRRARSRRTGRRPASGAATCWRGCSRPRSPPPGTLAVQPADRPDQAGALAGGAARPHLAGAVGGQRRRRRRQPGVAGAGRVMASRHRLGQRQPQDRFHRPGPRGAPADLRRCHPAQPVVAADPGNPEEPRGRDGPVPRPRWLRRARRAGAHRPGQRGDQGPGGTADRRDPGGQGRHDRRHHRRRLPGTAGLPRRRRRQHQPVLLPAAAHAGRLPAGGPAHGPGIQDARAADHRAAGRPLPDRLPAGPRPDHRLPAGTPARGRPRDAAEPVARPGRPVLA